MQRSICERIPTSVRFHGEDQHKWLLATAVKHSWQKRVVEEVKTRKTTNGLISNKRDETVFQHI